MDGRQHRYLINEEHDINNLAIDSEGKLCCMTTPLCVFCKWLLQYVRLTSYDRVDIPVQLYSKVAVSVVR